MTYILNKPATDAEVQSLTKADLRQRHERFVAAIPHRLLGLEEAVRATPGFEAWRADMTPDSLLALGRWFAAEVATRPRTSDEMRALTSASPYPIEIPTWELTDRTLSLALDIGTFFGQVLMRGVPGLRWEVELRDRRDVDYGRSVLTGAGPVAFSPLLVMSSLAYGLARGSMSAERLFDLYAVWRATLNRRA